LSELYVRYHGMTHIHACTCTLGVYIYIYIYIYIYMCLYSDYVTGREQRIYIHELKHNSSNTEHVDIKRQGLIIHYTCNRKSIFKLIIRLIVFNVVSNNVIRSWDGW